jgi:glycosyltransferase involved in cell wall biosynthesis
MLFVGNAKPQKNLTRTLDAFAAVLQDHPDTHLVVTTELPTSSSDARLETLANQVQSLGIGDHMTQLGIIDDMPSLMASCDVLIAPFIDSLGPSDYFVAVLEAMASGRPTVVSRVGGMPEVVESSWGRLIDPQNTSEIAQAMGEYVADEDLRKRSGDLARAFCEATFKPASVAATWNGIYEEIIG